MSEGWIAFYAALGGAVVGGGAAIAAAWVQQRSEQRREFVRLAFEAAIEEFKMQQSFALNRSAATGRTVVVPPLLVWIYHHWRIADLVYKRSFDAATIEGVLRDQAEVIAALEKLVPRGGGA